MTKNQKNKTTAQQNIPELIDVTIDGVTLSFTEDECINPNDWVPLDDVIKRIPLAEEISEELTINVGESELDFYLRRNAVHHECLRTGIRT